MIRIDILVDNSVATGLRLKAEHGFSAHISTPAGSYLFDCGASGMLVENAALLGIDLAALDGVLLSHGHRDHSGGLSALANHDRPLPLYAHPEADTPRFRSREGKLIPLGMEHPFREQGARGFDLRLSREPALLGDWLTLSGEVPRMAAGAPLDKGLVWGDPPVDDPFPDDQSLYIRTGEGIVILLGCAHAGVENIVRHAQVLFPEQPIRALIGGTHLGFADAESFERAASFLDEAGIGELIVGHCTGIDAAARLFARFPDRVRFSTAGLSLHYPLPVPSIRGSNV